MSVLIVPAPVKVIPLLVLKVKEAEVFKIPPLKVMLAAVKDAGTAPKFLSALTFKIPEIIVVVPYALLVFDKVNVDAPFWVKFVTFEPITASIKIGDPDPEFVIVPVLLMDVFVSVIPFVIELLLFKTKLPVPEKPPVI